MRGSSPVPAVSLLVPAVFLGLGGCGPRTGGGAAPGPVLVTVSEPVSREITDYNEFTGRIAAPDSVEVRARVWGYLDKVNFKEGALVKKGDILFEIDPRTYKAALDQSRAKVTLDEAQLKYTDAEYRRNLNLRRSGAVSAEDVEKSLAARDTAAAAVGADKADVEVKKLDLEFTRVTAPVSGRVGRAIVTAGNLIQSGQNGGGTLLTTLVSVDPVYAYFDVDEGTMLRVQELIRLGKFKSAREAPIPVTMGVANSGTFPYEGKVDFVDNQVNPGTGTIRLRAVVPNPEGFLNPGQFVRVRVPVGAKHPALLISDRAVDTNQGQKVVYKVVKNKDGKDEVAEQNVTLGAKHDGLRVVEQGVENGDRVIVNGLQRVRPGALVEAKKAEMPVSAPDPIPAAAPRAAPKP